MSSVGLIAGGSAVFFGAILASVQHGLNVRAERRMDPELRERFYPARKGKVAMGAAPTWDGTSAGLALVGVW